MKKKIRFLCMSALLATTPLVSSCGFFDFLSGQVDQFVMKGYSLNYSEKTVVAGQSFEILLYRDNSDGTRDVFDLKTRYIKGSSVESSNPEIVKVSSTGFVTPVKEGEATITYNVGEFGKLTCKVSVVPKVLETLTLKRLTKYYKLGKQFVFKGAVVAKYTTGFEEGVTPVVDSSNVNINLPGEYPITISYTCGGVSKTITGQTIIITDDDSLLSTKVEMKYGIDDLEHNGGHSTFVSALPCEGTSKTLIIPVKFSDSNTYISNYSNVKSDIEKVFFGNQSEIGWHSVKSYYETESEGKVTFTGVVSDWYTSSHASTEFYKDANVYGVEDLRDDAVDWYFSNHLGESRSDYDLDHDGFMDGVYIVYGSPDYRNLDVSKSDAGTMWAMVRSKTDTPDVSNPKISKYFWTSYDFIYPNETIAKGRTGKSGANNNPGVTKASDVILDTHTFIHETGHMYGIVDYYSYTSSDWYASEAHMQSETVMGHDPYSLLLFNWADAYIPDDTTTIDINDIQQAGHDMILLTPEWNSDDSPFDEYLLLELFAPTGLNQYDSLYNNVYREVGIRLFHVDARLFSTNLTETHVPQNNYFSVIDNSPDELSGNFSELKDYAELFLVRNDKELTFDNTKFLKSTDYFKQGDTFKIADYSKQFRNGTKLDNGKEFNWEFTVDSIYANAGGYGATITVTKK